MASQPITDEFAIMGDLTENENEEEERNKMDADEKVKLQNLISGFCFKKCKLYFGKFVKKWKYL